MCSSNEGPGLLPNTASLADEFHQGLCLIPVEVLRRVRGINGYVTPFRKEREAWDRTGDA